MDSSLIQTIVVYALPVIFAITLHEAAHGYVARMLGDNTAYVLGRVSFNPMRHIDPLGTIAIPLLLYFATSGAFMFGYAKPVPVAFGNLRNPRWGSLWVALAGPMCNFISGARLGRRRRGARGHERRRTVLHRGWRRPASASISCWAC